MCLIIGPDSSCNCSTGYTWSNSMCYNYNCCSDTTCNANVSYITSVCVPKANGNIFCTPWCCILHSLHHLYGKMRLFPKRTATNENVFDHTVLISGSVTLNSMNWDSNKLSQVCPHLFLNKNWHVPVDTWQNTKHMFVFITKIINLLQSLNGLQYQNVTNRYLI